ncbi:MAG: hypothetical protein KFH98_12455 [Gemmatimonadetes bacterium]|nr:hypothetical protein [Gemmatimonadota bacterium]
MSTKGGDDRQAKLVRKVVFTYRLEGDPKDMERTFTLEHGGAGEEINGLIWNDDLMRKLAYLEREVCTEPKKAPGTGDWKVYSADQKAAGERECIWFHDHDCMWWEYCSPA